MSCGSTFRSLLAKSVIYGLLVGLLLGSNPVVNSPIGKSELSASLSEGNILASHSNLNSPSPIVVLLKLGSPAAVFGTIHAINVNSINGATFGSFPHVLDKGIEAFNPSIAHLNSPASVIMEVKLVRIGASELHMRPALVGSLPCGISGHSMPFTRKTAAAFSGSSLHIGQDFFAYISAITHAFNHSLSFGYSGDNELVETHGKTVFPPKDFGILIHDNHLNMLTYNVNC